MLKIFILVLLYSLSAYCKTEAECLTKMLKETKKTEEEVTKMLMTCNNMFLDGQHLFLRVNKRTDMIIRKRYPSSDPQDNADGNVSSVERAQRLLDYTICEEMAELFKRYMKQCEVKWEQSRVINSLN